VKIPCIYWSKVSKAKVPTMKKLAIPASKSALTEEDLSQATTGQIKRDTTYRNPEDPDVELAAEERVKGYKYGPQYVPVTAEEEDMFKLKSLPSVTVIGAVAAQSLPRHHFLEGPLFLQGNVASDAAQVSIMVLSRTLKEQGQVLLARFVKRENADPYLVALMPSDEGRNSPFFASEF
jgi:ATP-dependent DNA helicase 2 subunit 2